MQDVKAALEPLLHIALTAEVQEQTSFVSASIMPNIYLTNNSQLRFIHFSPDSNQIFWTAAEKYGITPVFRRTLNRKLKSFQSSVQSVGYMKAAPCSVW